MNFVLQEFDDLSTQKQFELCQRIATPTNANAAATDVLFQLIPKAQYSKVSGNHHSQLSLFSRNFEYELVAKVFALNQASSQECFYCNKPSSFHCRHRRTIHGCGAKHTRGVLPTNYSKLTIKLPPYCECNVLPLSVRGRRTIDNAHACMNRPSYYRFCPALSSSAQRARRAAPSQQVLEQGHMLHTTVAPAQGF